MLSGNMYPGKSVESSIPGLENDLKSLAIDFPSRLFPRNQYYPSASTRALPFTVPCKGYIVG